MKHAFPIVALILYAISALLYARLFMKRDAKYSSSGRITLAIGFLCHAVFIVMNFLDGHSASHPTTLSTLSALIAAVFLATERKYKFSMLGVIAVPLSFGFLFASAIIFHATRDTAVLSVYEPVLIGHLISCILSLLAFAIAFVFSCGVILKDWALRTKKVSLFHEKLPALEQLEEYSSKAVKYGFWLMLVGVITGSFVAINQEVEMFFFDSKFLWSVSILGIYAGLIIARDHWGFRGSRAGWLAVAGFVAVVLSIVLLNFSENTFHVY